MVPIFTAQSDLIWVHPAGAVTCGDAGPELVATTAIMASPIPMASPPDGVAGSSTIEAIAVEAVFALYPTSDTDVPGSGGVSNPNTCPSARFDVSDPTGNVRIPDPTPPPPAACSAASRASSAAP